jgi:hypothetical protein
MNLTEFTKKCNISLTASSKVKVFANHNRASPKTLHQNSLDKILGCFSSLILVKANNGHGIETGIGQEFNLALVLGEKFRY